MRGGGNDESYLTELQTCRITNSIPGFLGKVLTGFIILERVVQGGEGPWLVHPGT